ncbi:MAG: type II toxin-antitoxin system VapC family toxin [Planctomycetota bacterium]|nr:type II toxin-antitoxin system VapC family toxin [Planctomycetota bacterium]
MSDYVVDASVAAKWFFAEVHGEEALRLLEPRHRLYAPDFLLVEFDNMVWKRVRRREIAAAEGRKVRAALRLVPIQTHPSGSLLDSAYELAVRTNCSIYDCLYVALAMRIEGRMVTADRRLYDALAPGPFAKYLAWVEDLVE